MLAVFNVNTPTYSSTCRSYVILIIWFLLTNTNGSRMIKNTAHYDIHTSLIIITYFWSAYSSVLLAKEETDGGF